MALFAAGMITGLILFFTKPAAFSWFIDEDGIAEWLTVIGLLACTVVCITRFIRLRNQKKKLFLIFLLLAALVFLFGAGEELSWGQRLFNIESSKFFVEHNTQQEINIHNLVFGKLRLNKLIFSLLLSICICLYLFVLPVLYRKSKKIKQLTDNLAGPVPRNYQIFAYILLFIIIGIITDSRKWELLEMGGALLFLAIFLNPLNVDIFQPHSVEHLKNKNE
jgi:predicted membrane metal-binding protein